MRILGVDPGTRYLGYGVLHADGAALRCLAWGTLKGGNGHTIDQRLFAIHQGLAGVVERWRPAHLAIEEPFVAPERGAKSAVAVGQAQAVALLLAAAAGMEVHRYSPTEVKRSVTNYGAGTKAQLQQTVRLLLDLGPDPMSEDASDAIAVALCHAQHWRTAERIRTL